MRAEICANYAQLAPHYDTDKSPVWQEIVDLVAGIGPRDSVLDVGCGTGRVSRVLSAQCRYVGIDLSEDMIRVARKRNQSRLFVIGDATRIPYPDESFDAVLMIAVLHHSVLSSEREKILQEAHRVLKPGGCMFASVWNLFQPRYWKRWTGWRQACIPNQQDPSVRRDYYVFTMPKLGAELSQAGFCIETLYRAKQGQKNLKWHQGRNIVARARKC